MRPAHICAVKSCFVLSHQTVQPLLAACCLLLVANWHMCQHHTECTFVPACSPYCLQHLDACVQVSSGPSGQLSVSQSQQHSPHLVTPEAKLGAAQSMLDAKNLTTSHAAQVQLLRTSHLRPAQNPSPIYDTSPGRPLFQQHGLLAAAAEDAVVAIDAPYISQDGPPEAASPSYQLEAPDWLPSQLGQLEQSYCIIEPAHDSPAMLLGLRVGLALLDQFEQQDRSGATDVLRPGLHVGQ